MLQDPTQPFTQKDIQMTDFAIQFRTAASEFPCGLCGNWTGSEVGPELVSVDGSAPICRECGRKAAPSLAALVALAQVAGRVGRIKRHTLVPPLEALLELAGAAEHYVSTSARARVSSKAEAARAA